MKNQIALLTGPRAFEIVNAPMPFVGPDDVLIKTCHVGVCGSDVEFYLDPTFHGRFHPEKPFVLGHEVGGKAPMLTMSVLEMLLRLNPESRVANVSTA